MRSSRKTSRRKGRSTSSSGSEGGRLLVDTSAYACLRRRASDALDALASATLVLVPTIVLGELYGGFELGGRLDENRAALREFLSEPFVRVTSPSADTARVYGKLFAALRRAGKPVPINDIWIAACAIDGGTDLLTSDRHFARFEGLSVRWLAANAG